MSRKRSHSFADAAADFHGAFMEPPGAAGRADADFLELEPEEELLCSVSGITEQLGRSITAALQTALADIRRTVSVRIRVLKMELREKSDEIEALKARLELPGGAEPSAEAAFRKPDSRLPDPRRARALMPGVKKENIDAICDYLMKDKNSRGDGDREARHDPDPHPLNLWPDGGMTGSGPGPGDPESATEDLFSILPSGSKRIYDYEWIAPMEYSPDLKVLKEPEGDSEPPATTEEDEEDDEEEDEEEEDPSRREGGGLDHNQNQVQVQVQVPLAHVQTPDFSLEARDSPGEGGSPLGGPDRPETGQPFPSHPYICSLCGTFCPDSLFLEEHMKLIHPDTAGGELQASSSSLVEGGGGAGGDARRTPAGVEQNDGGGGVASQAGAGPAKKEIKMEGGYECGDCGRHFNYLGNLRQHQRIHTGEKPFACPECGERFRHAARLKSHRLVHSGAQSPFPCPQCGKGFSVLSGLKRHQRVHTGESPYACPQCGRRFKELGNLYTHQRIHSGATPYCCQQCGRSFRHLGTYKSHRCTPLSLQ